MKKMLNVFLLVGLIMFLWNPKPALCGVSGAKPAEFSIEMAKNKSISRIMLVLENRVEDRKFHRKAIEKLESLDYKKIQLISSLCDKVATDSTSAGSDIAFSLVSIIIILS